MTRDQRPTPIVQPPAPDEPWAELRRFTAARIALPRSGASLATAPLLEFRLAHARARDAVHAPFDPAQLCGALAPLGLPVLSIASAAQDRQQYLMRPDLGRRLADDAAALLAAQPAAAATPAAATTSCSSSPTACPRARSRRMRSRC